MAKPSRNEPDAALARIRQKLEQTRVSNNNTRTQTDCDSSGGSGSDCDVLEQFHEYEHEVSLENELIPALAMRCYHLPGYSFCADWIQYFQNNHPVLGLCCHHVQHPVRVRLRLLHLTGSLVFGVAVTNIIWLYFFYNGSNQQAPAITINMQGFNSESSSLSDEDVREASPASPNTASNNELTISQGMLLCWTLGALLHAIFDNCVWYMTACVCCLSSSHLDAYRKWGTYCIVVSVLLITTVATFALVVRTSAEDAEDRIPYSSGSNIDEEQQQLSLHEASMYKLFMSYAIEFMIALFIYYPMIATILFSGILGCGNVPILGGRPYEIKLEAIRQAKQHHGRCLGLDMLPFELPKLPDSPRINPRHVGHSRM